jgi:cathepsin C
VISYCNTTFPGWSHQAGIDPVDWACYKAKKIDTKKSIKSHIDLPQAILESYYENTLYTKNLEFIRQINDKQSSWVARHYDFFEHKTIGDLIRMAGGKKSKILGKPRATVITQEIQKIAYTLPDSFDWRNVNGINYVSPIRDQGNCGSCYAFGSMGMNECRLRVKTNNTLQTIFSTQDIVSCSQYSQGCDGGFPYLVGGKYAEDFGLVEETCNPYVGKDGPCTTKQDCPRQYSTNYRYVGGFYGACNEALMKIELVKNGPLAVSFEVYDDFLKYSGGIYHHTYLRDEINFKFNPFELTNHVGKQFTSYSFKNKYELI